MNVRWSMQKVGGSIIAVGLVLSLVWHFGFAWWVNPPATERMPWECPNEIPEQDSTATDSL